uniref:NADAR domain-containing protein n=1 Tax=viral metagenome TaxID=1070528 RepID=A0A6C0IJM3_9ZZZZ
MVKSLLVPDIDYIENIALLPEDKDQEVALYEITLNGKDEEIALGQPVYTFIERNLVYYPIYLVKNEKVTQQIGLYEVFADNIVNVLDADGDIELEKMMPPILYGSVDIDVPSMSSTEKKEPETAGEPLKEQTELDAEKERAEYTPQQDEHWLQSYFENNNYRMIDNEGKGDCLFAVIRDALAKVGISKSVGEMRKILAENVTEDIYQGYKTIFSDSFDTDAQLVKEIKVLVARHKELKKKIDTLKDRNAKQAVIIQADEIKKRHELAKRERAYTKSVVEGELKMMKNVHNLAQFKVLLQTCAFWGDTWAISTLERVLNMKIILFSEESFLAGDLDNVLTCGQLNDTVLEEKGIFKPDYYILAIYQGYHYQLISYKDKGALTFQELPYYIKAKVVDKCLERLAGPYYIIPDFREFMEVKKGIASAKQTGPVKHAEVKQAGPVKQREELMQSDLYDNTTVFQFYNKSVDKPPGKGAGEIMPAGEAPEYKELKQIPDWRRKLDNLWLSPFTLDGHKWNSVEHYYQGSKFKRTNPDFYLKFSADSGSALSKDPAEAEGAGGKSGKYGKEHVRPKTIKVDDDFFTKGRNVTEMEAAQYAKFSQNPEMKTILVTTKKSKLQHFSRGAPPVIFIELMKVRQRLL